jgi:dynein intermediate chain 2, axonemal
MWWDTRNLSEPLDSLELYSQSNSSEMILGGSSLEYSSEAGPTKYLVGTEQGSVISVNLRNRKTNNGVSVFDEGPGKHHGPVYSIQRNPTHNKFFMSIGDWSTKIWSEDIKTPIVTSKYHNSYLTGGCWSPTRPGVFYVTTMDGELHVWDYYHSQNEVAHSHKIGTSALSAIGIEGNTQCGGKLVAVGDVDGSVSILEVSDSLAIPQANEKTAIGNMFEREGKREKNLEAREREMKRAKAIAEEQISQNNPDGEKNTSPSDEDILAQINSKFQAILNADDGNDNEDKENTV